MLWGSVECKYDYTPLFTHMCGYQNYGSGGLVVCYLSFWFGSWTSDICYQNIALGLWYVSGTSSKFHTPLPHVIGCMHSGLKQVMTGLPVHQISTCRVVEIIFKVYFCHDPARFPVTICLSEPLVTKRSGSWTVDTSAYLSGCGRLLPTWQATRHPMWYQWLGPGRSSATRWKANRICKLYTHTYRIPICHHWE